jgi:hypothetical protein
MVSAQPNIDNDCSRLLSLKLALVMFFVSALISSPYASAQSETIDELGYKILDAELELQELNAHLHLEGANSGFEHSRRRWLWNSSDALPTEGGLIAATAVFYSHYNDKTKVVEVTNERTSAPVASVERIPNPISAGAEGATIIPQIEGQVSGGTGDFFELIGDYSRARRLHKNRLNGAAVRRTALSLKRRIDRMQAEYEALASTAKSKIFTLEANLLKDIRNKSLVEFNRLETNASRVLVGRVIEDGASFTRNTVGTIGNTINLVAIYEHNRRLDGEGAILNLTAATMITVRPLLSNLGSYISTKLSDHIASKNFPDIERTEEVNFASDLTQLQNACDRAAISPRMEKRLIVYRKLQAQFDEDDNLASKEQQRLKQIAIRRYRESIYGPTKLAQSTMVIIVGFRKDNPVADNRLLAAANLTYTSGQAFNIFELQRERIVDEVNHHNLKINGMLPAPRLGRSLQALKTMRSYLDQ